MANGLVATFYSYKGGVGRSFALASVATALASWGYQVLAIDWDLDAPGLWRYFKLPEPKTGLLELIVEQGGNSGRSWKSAIIKPKLPSFNGHLDLLTAGRQDQNYVTTLQEMNWTQLYEREGLAQTLEQWRSEWKDSYDVVLIDSRTGITDIGALCTVHLPDILFLFFTANQQSLQGAKEVAERSVASRSNSPLDRAALPVVPVPSRFDSREEYERAQKWRETFARELEELCQPWVDKSIEVGKVLERITIPYVAYWSFGEGLPVLEEESRGADSMRIYLETLAALIGNRLEATPLMAENPDGFIEKAIRSGRRLGGLNYDILMYGGPGTDEMLHSVSQILKKYGYRVIELQTEKGKELDLRSEFQQLFKQSQHLVFLLGAKIGTTEIDLLRQAAKWTLEDSSHRTLLPLLWGSPDTVRLGPILDGVKVAVDINVEPLDIVKRIQESLGGVPTRQAPSPPIDNTARATLQRLKSQDPLVRESAIRILARLGRIPPEEWLEQGLSDGNINVRRTSWEAVQQLGITVPFEIYIRLSRHKSWSIRSDALEALSQIDTEEAFNLIVDLLGDEAPEVRSAAVKALANSPNPLAAEWLLPRITDNDANVRIGAITGLIAKGNPSFNSEILRRTNQWELLTAIRHQNSTNAIANLLKANAKPENFPWNDCIQMLGVLGDQQAAELLLEQLDQAKNWKAPADALGQFDSEFVFEQLQVRLQTSNTELRFRAAYAIGQLKTEARVEVLEDLVRDENGAIRLAAIAGVGQTANQATLGVLVQGLDDRMAQVRVEAAKALGKIDAKTVPGELVKAMTDRDGKVRQAAATALANIGNDVSISALINYAQGNDPDAKLLAIEALGTTSRKEAVPALISCLNIEDNKVTMAALESIASIGIDDPTPVIKLAEHQDASLRGAAARTLGGIVDPLVEEVLAKLASDEVKDVRIDALRALGRSASTSALGIVAKSLEDNDPELRFLAIEILANALGGQTARLLSRNLDGKNPWIDPASLIETSRLKLIRRILKIPEDEARKLYEELDQRLGRRLNIQWLNRTS